MDGGRSRQRSFFTPWNWYNRIVEKERVCIETSFVSVLTAKPSSDIIQAARQLASRSWWDCDRHSFEAYGSQAVVREVSRGDALAAERRLKVLSALTMLEITVEAEELAISLLRDTLVPEKAEEDALHIAICVSHGMDYLLTWNCRHIANAVVARRIYRYLESKGFQPPMLCTPFELQEREHESS